MGNRKGMSHSKAEREMRVQEVFEMVVNGKSTFTIVKHCKEKWGVANTTAYAYVTSADKKLTTVLATKREVRINRAIAQREMLIEKMLDSDQLAVAGQMMGDSAKLMGLYEQVDVGANVNIKVVQK